MNNSSLLTADRTTHVKIVVVGLLAATLVAGLGVASRVNDAATPTAGRMEATVIKAGKPITAATTADRTVR